MNKLLIAALVVMPLAALAATNEAASSAGADIQAAIDISTHGDTVLVPAGSNAITAEIISTNLIRLIGAGTNATILVDELVNRSLHPIRFYLTNSSVAATALITGFQFRGGDVNTDNNQGFLMVQGSAWRTNTGPYSNLRVTGNHWYLPNGRPSAYYAFGNILNDNNGYDLDTSGCLVFSAAPNSLETGHGSWAADADYGGWQGKVYFERNIVTRTTGGAWVDGWGGARYVIRSNTVVNVSFQNHGTDSSGQYRSCRVMEIYGNSQTGPASQLEAAVHSRGGSGVIWGNYVDPAATTYPALVRLANYRETMNAQTPFGGAQGTNVFDLNDETLFASGTHTGIESRVLQDSGASLTPNQFDGIAHVINLQSGRAGRITTNSATVVTTDQDTSGAAVSVWWTNGNTYQIRKAIRLLDGNGNGAGALLTGSSSSIPPTPQEWPNQAEEGWYIWGNTGRTNVSISSYTIVAERDYFFGTPKPDYTPLGVHPLAGGSTTPPAGDSAVFNGNVKVNGRVIITGP